MNIIFAILFFIQSGISYSDRLDEQIYIYFQNIENQEDVSESLWSLIDIYLDKESRAERVESIGRAMEINWIDLFNSDQGPREMIHLISLHFENEHLQTYLHLLIPSREDKEYFFNEFYSNSSNTKLKNLNEKIVEESTVHFDDLNWDEWDFNLYLILYFTKNIEGVNHEFYDGAYNKLKSIKDNSHGYSQLVDDFINVSIFEALYRTNRYAAILNYYDELIELHYFPNSASKRNMYWGLDFALYRTGYIDLSLDVQRRHTIPLTEQLEGGVTLNAILASHGGYLYTIGRYSEAREVFNTALADTANLNATIKTRLLNNLSLVYYKLGESNLYIENQFRALDFAVERNNYSDQLNIYRNLHIYYRKNRNWDLALQYIEEAMDLAETTYKKNELVSIIISKAVHYHQYLNDTEAAYNLLTEAEDLLGEITDYRLKVRALYEQASIYEKLEEFEKSLEIYIQVLAIGSENNNDAMYLEALADLAKIELLQNNTERSKQYIREFNIHDVTVTEFNVLVEARRIEAEIAYIEGRYRDAEKIIKRVYSQVLERARNTTNLEAGYWHIEPEYLTLFTLYANLLTDQKRHNDLVNIFDQLKTINDASLINNPLIRADLLSEEELTENRRIKSDIDVFRKKLLVADGNERLSIQNEISSLTARKNQLSHRANEPDLFRDLQLWNIQSGLKHGEMIFHVTNILDRLYIFMIDRNDIHLQSKPFSDNEKTLFENAINGLANGDTDLNVLYDVYKFLELDSLPTHISKLVIAPDSYLYQLPLDVLPVTAPNSAISYGSSEYLIEKIEVNYINNLQEFMRNERHNFYELDFTGIGISDFAHTSDGQLLSLPNAVYEIEQIASRTNRINRKKTLIESEATPRSFMANAPNSRILHLASHSKISENDPLFSTIYLYPDENSDTEQDGISGQLFAYQLFDLNLRNELIMLNSCESGSGDYFQGAGIMGISRALRYAGAKSLILNSWSVNDQFASDFAIEFYDNINMGKSKSNSLREAKIYFLKNKNANPHFWGPYMLNGDSKPVVDPPGKQMMFAFFLFIFAAGFVFTQKKLNRERNGFGLKYRLNDNFGT
jgi:hypothetical protein